MPFTQLPGWVGAGQALQENQLMMEGQKADLQSLALQQEDARLTLQQKQLDLANQEAFKQTVLAKLSAGEETEGQLATASGQPTEFQKLNSGLEDLHDRMQNHISLVQATQAAIQEYAHKDPLYAQRMQNDLDKQIKAGFDLNKEQFEMQSKEAEKVSNELYPVLNDGETGKFNPDLYREWYSKRRAEGVPLASMGLTGDPTMDEKPLRLLSAKGIAAKDQINAHYREVQEKQKQWENTLRERQLTETTQHHRAMEASAQSRSAARAPKAVDPIAATDKDQVAAHDKYQIQYEKLKARFDRANRGTSSAPPDPQLAADIAKDIRDLNLNYEAKQKLIFAQHGTVPKGASAASRSSAPSVEDDLISQYSPK